METKKEDILISESATNKLKVSIYNFKNGMETFENVAAVRVINKDHRFLFMSDYTPTLGEVNGTVIILKQDEEIKYENITGFFALKDNTFRLVQDDLSKKNDEVKVKEGGENK